jgi:hypothetical protein
MYGHSSERRHRFLIFRSVGGSSLDTTAKARTVKFSAARLPPMKKLPYCTLVVGALFVTFGIRELFRLKAQIEPFGLLFPLLWDMTMVGIGVGIVLKADCGRKAGMCWCVFSLIASLFVGIAAIFWITHPRYVPFSLDRMFFVLLAVVFGLIFGIWQLLVLRGPAHKKHCDSVAPHAHPGHTG